MVKQYHPDVNPSPGAAKKFMMVEEAYAILSDAEAKRAYDRKLANRRKLNQKAARRSARDRRRPQTTQAWTPPPPLQHGYYATLGVDVRSSPQEIQAAYLQLSRECHPTQGRTKDRLHRFLAIEQAYFVLKDWELRYLYDTRFIYNNWIRPAREKRAYTLKADEIDEDPNLLEFAMEDGRMEAIERSKMSMDEYLIVQSLTYGKLMARKRIYLFAVGLPIVVIPVLLFDYPWARILTYSILPLLMIAMLTILFFYERIVMHQLLKRTKGN